MKFGRPKHSLLLGLLILILGAVWQFNPVADVRTVAALIDPVKLAGLGERGANPRLNKLIYWLWHAEQRGLSPESSLSWALWLNGQQEPQAGLVKEALLRNVKIATQLGLLDAQNLDHLRHGRAAIVRSGPYRGEAVEIDHIVPYSLAPEVGNDLANLEMLPRTLNRRKSNLVNERQLAHAERLHTAGLLTQKSLDQVRKKFSR
ncbi:MAG: hypothetical protein DVB32_04665 [Verrucomicrobia bacterium]|nr:MAG: hypothetical protein DVB32_04665 [Verrucomicrobiota bacterium]